MAVIPQAAARELTWLIDPKQSRFGYWFVYACGVLQLFGAGTIVYHGQTLQEVGLASCLGLCALLFLSVARALGSRKGGVACLPDGSVELYGRNERDRLTVPGSRLAGVLVKRREEYWGGQDSQVLVWSVSLPTIDGTSLFLLEPQSGDDASEVGLMLRQVLKVPVLSELPELKGEAPAVLGLQGRREGGKVSWILSAGMNWAFSPQVMLLALFSLLSGGLLLVGVEATGVAGFLFGPVFCALGLCLVFLWLVRSFGGDVLILDGKRLEHYTFLGPYSWGRKSVDWTGADFQARVKTRGSQGFALELVCGNRIVVLGAGSTTGSRVGPADLVELGNYLQHRYVVEKSLTETEE